MVKDMCDDLCEKLGGNIDDYSVILVGNKSDEREESQREVSLDEASELADSYEIQYRECSARDPKIVEGIFVGVLEKLVHGNMDLAEEHSEEKEWEKKLVSQASKTRIDEEPRQKNGSSSRSPEHKASPKRGDSSGRNRSGSQRTSAQRSSGQRGSGQNPSNPECTVM